jgi:hypothetical protein
VVIALLLIAGGAGLLSWHKDPGIFAWRAVTICWLYLAAAIAIYTVVEWVQ